MLDLNEIEYAVIIADRLYTAKAEKVQYVNTKLKLIDSNGNQLDPNKKPISNAKFYRILKRTKEKTKERLHQIALHFTEKTLVDFELLEQMSAKQYQAADAAFNEKNWTLFGKLAKDWIECLPAVTAMRETCEWLHKESKWSGLDDIDPPRPPPKYRAFSE